MLIIEIATLKCYFQIFVCFVNMYSTKLKFSFLHDYESGKLGKQLLSFGISCD